MSNEDFLFDSEEQQNATLRVLATLRIKVINEEIDKLMEEILKYALNIDNLLDENKLEKRYLEKVANVSDLSEMNLDEDLLNINFRVKELINDFIKRINTRISLVKNNYILIDELQSDYDLSDSDLDKDIELAKLNKEDFI